MKPTYGVIWVGQEAPPKTLHIMERDEVELRTQLSICGYVRTQHNQELIRATPAQVRRLPVCQKCEDEWKRSA